MAQESAFEREHRSPLRVSSFVGRRREIVELSKLLDGSRLVTVTGPGGTGKTRLR
jgi:hypothetical protein